MQITGNCMLITGGATGIGLEMARQFASLGNRVIICGRRQEALADAKRMYPQLQVRQCDVGDAHSRSALVEWLRNEHPDLNVLINNAGIQRHRQFKLNNACAGVEEEVSTNLIAPILLTADLLPMLLGQVKSYVVNVTSGLAFAPLSHLPVYCATKAGFHSFTVSLRHQLRETSVKVIEFAPPLVDTSLRKQNLEAGHNGPPMMMATDCVRAAIAQLSEGCDEILVGTSPILRAKGEELFSTMNR